MRTAIVHYWLLHMRGGEKVIEALCRMLPDADIFTLFYDPERVSPTIRRHTVHTSYLQPFHKHYKSLLPLMPMALERFDLRDYDLVISSESGPAKGVLVRSSSRHICYCHTPMRYLWELYPEYRNQWTRSPLQRLMLDPLTHYLRMWDFASAARVDTFVANSENVSRRIQRAYRRSSTVVCPPVEVATFYSKAAEDYYLIVAELVPYKRVDAAIRVFSRTGRKLKIVGEGPEFKRLRAIAAGNIEFCGRVSDTELRELYAGCVAFLMPAEEDFGITAVEALASGKPVVALGRGGACETVPQHDPFGGILYREATDGALEGAVELFEASYNRVNPLALQRWAKQFSAGEFTRKMQAVLQQDEWTNSPEAMRATAPSLHS